MCLQTFRSFRWLTCHAYAFQVQALSKEILGKFMHGLYRFVLFFYSLSTAAEARLMRNPGCVTSAGTSTSLTSRINGKKTATHTTPALFGRSILRKLSAQCFYWQFFYIRTDSCLIINVIWGSAQLSASTVVIREQHRKRNRAPFPWRG